MIAPHGDRRAITCDAGALVNGLCVAGERGIVADVVVREIKYPLKKGLTPPRGDPQPVEADNDVGVRFVIPDRGNGWRF